MKLSGSVSDREFFRGYETAVEPERKVDIALGMHDVTTRADARICTVPTAVRYAIIHLKIRGTDIGTAMTIQQHTLTMYCISDRPNISYVVHFFLYRLLDLFPKTSREATKSIFSVQSHMFCLLSSFKHNVKNIKVHSSYS